MKKWYFIEYYQNFSNTFRLYWGPEGTPTPDNMDRITRAAAFEKISLEKWARKTDRSFSGNGATVIYPLEFDDRDIMALTPPTKAILAWNGYQLTDGAIIEKSKGKG